MSPAPRRHNPALDLGFNIDPKQSPQPKQKQPARTTLRDYAARAANACVLIINALVAIGLVVSAYASWVDPAVHPIAAAINLSFAGWLWASLLLFAIDLLWWRRTAWVPGLAMLACVSQIHSYMPLNLPHWRMSQQDKELSFTLMTYNAYSFNDYEGDAPGFNRQLEYILEKNPSVVCIQEAMHLAPTKQNAITQQQLDSMRTAYPYVLTQGRDFALLSKFPVEPINLDFPEKDFESGGIAAWRLNIHGKVVNLFSVHLRSFGLSPDDKNAYRDIIRLDSISRSEIREARSSIIPKLKSAGVQRSQQIAYLQKYLQRYGGKNAIVAGDFNDTETSYAVHALCSDSRMNQTYAEVGFGPMITYSGTSLFFRIDHILYRGAMRPYRITRGSLRASDHYPLLATFIITP